MPTIIYRHRKENRKKCTLTPIEKQDGFCFLTYPIDKIEEKSALLLSLQGKELSFSDSHRDLLLLDSSWRNLPKMQNAIPCLETRTLPKDFKTAYPRRQADCEEPDRGLASIEALYIAFTILQRKKEYLLSQYHFKEKFLQMNKDLLNFYEENR